MDSLVRFGIIFASAALIISVSGIALKRPDILVPLWPVGGQRQVSEVSAAPRILWSAGMEQGNLDEWTVDGGGGKFNTGAGDTVPSRDYAHSGYWSMKATISGSESAATRLFRWKEAREHRELYYSAWYLIPRPYRLDPGGATNWFQFKSRMALLPWRHDPIFLIGWRNVGPHDAMHLLLRWWGGLSMEGPSPGQQGERSWVSPIEMPVGRWFHLEARYVCAADFGGAIQVWQDGVQIFNVVGVKTRHPISDCRWSVNNYGARISPRPVVTYVDDAVISTGRIQPALMPEAQLRAQTAVTAGEVTDR